MKLRPMRPHDQNFLKKKAGFAEAVHVTQKLGLHHLMGIQCHYNEYYVKQFFSTLVIKGDHSLSMKWMTGDTYCESDFQTFGQLLGYAFIGSSIPSGHRIHVNTRPSKDILSDLYLPGHPVGKVAGLKPL